MSTTTILYLGGPTALLQYGGLRILLDPTFDPPQTYPSDGEPLTKTAGPAIGIDELGDVDLVLLSHHEHEDNLDYSGAELVKRAPLTLSTAKAGTDLGRPVVGLDPWEATTVGDCTVTAVPALHGPPGIEPMVGPVIGFVLEAPDAPAIYVSGDNASLALVEQIAGAFTIDVAILFAGAARVPSIDAALTLTSADAAAAARILGSPVVVGLHVEDWEHFSESRADLEAAFATAGLSDVLVDTPRGETVVLHDGAPGRVPAA